MQLFTYHYMDEIRKSVAYSFLENGRPYFRVLINDGLECTIASSGIPDPENKTIWVQSHKPGETVLAHDLIQALGEGIERAGANI
jgi:hypothetical protein